MYEEQDILCGGFMEQNLTSQKNKQQIEDEYNMLMSSLHVSVSKHYLDEHFTVLEANDYYYEMIGYPKEEYEALFHNQCDTYFTDNIEDWHDIVQCVTNMIEEGRTTYDYIGRMKHKNGTLMWVQLHGSLTKEVHDGYTICFTVMTNITDIMETRLEQNVTYNNLPGFVVKLQAAPDGLKFLSANQSFHEFFKSLNILPDVWYPMDADIVYPEIREHWSQFLSGDSVHFTLYIQSNEKEYYLQLNGECIDHVDGNPIYIIVFIDITDVTQQRELLKQSNQQLEKLAYVDPITKGDNRNRFELKANKLLMNCKPGTYALVSLDLQKFKLINDFYGIEKGNETLVKMSQVLKHHLQEDEFVARIDADVFNLLLKYDNQDAMISRMQKITSDINKACHHLPSNYVMLFSAGIYPIDDPTQEITTMRDRCNVTRKTGKSVKSSQLCTCFFYNELDRQQLMHEKDMENRMRDALKNEEFIVYLQPKVSLTDMRVCGAEALVRWMDPEQGLIPPNDFIPFFEKNKMIVDIDLYVFEEICKKLRHWIDDGHEPIPVSINMSRVHLQNADFMEPYESIRKRYDIEPHLLDIELTETLVLIDPTILFKVIDTIHAYGYTCSIDDFGSGYSSLGLLKYLKADTIKLDRAFFQSPLSDDERENYVIKAILDLARQLQMKSIAEGVETKEQQAFLKTTCCDMVQGYVNYRPMPADEFEALLLAQLDNKSENGGMEYDET